MVRAGSATPSDTIQAPPMTWMPQTNKRVVGVRALALEFQVGCIQGCCLDALLQHQYGVSILPLQPYKHFNFFSPLLSTESKAIMIHFLFVC